MSTETLTLGSQTSAPKPFLDAGTEESTEFLQKSISNNRKDVEKKHLQCIFYEHLRLSGKSIRQT